MHPKSRLHIIAILFLDGYSNESVSESNITVSSIVLANDIGVIVLTLFVSENFFMIRKSFSIVLSNDAYKKLVAAMSNRDPWTGTSVVSTDDPEMRPTSDYRSRISVQNHSWTCFDF